MAAGGGGYGGRLPARPRTPVFREAQKHVRARLEKKWLAGFMSTPEFIERNGGSILSVEKREGSQSATPSKSFMVGEPECTLDLSQALIPLAFILQAMKTGRGVSAWEQG